MLKANLLAAGVGDWGWGIGGRELGLGAGDRVLGVRDLGTWGDVLLEVRKHLFITMIHSSY